MNHAATPAIDVVAGVIRRDDGSVLIARRPAHLHQGGLWEFPGGKREAGESRFDALARELREELAIDVTVATPLLRLRHAYATKCVNLDIWEVTGWRGEARGAEGQPIRWVRSADLQRYTFPPANRTILIATRLPRIAVRVSLDDCRGESVPAIIARYIDRGARLLLVDATASFDARDRRALAALCRDTGSQVLFAADAITPSGERQFVALNESWTAGGDTSAERPAVARSTRETRLPHDAAGADIDFLVMSEDRTGIDQAAAAANALKDTLRTSATPLFIPSAFEPAALAHAIRMGCQGIIVPAAALTGDTATVASVLSRGIAQASVDRAADERER